MDGAAIEGFINGCKDWRRKVLILEGDVQACLEEK